CTLGGGARLFAGDHCRNGAGGGGERFGRPVLGAGVGEHSDVRAAVSVADGTWDARGNGQIFLAERVFVGAGAVRDELVVWGGGHDESDRNRHVFAIEGRGGRSTAVPAGAGAVGRGAVVPNHGGAVSLLRAGCVPRGRDFERGDAVVHSESGRLCGPGAADSADRQHGKPRIVVAGCIGSDAAGELGNGDNGLG